MSGIKTYGQIFLGSLAVTMALLMPHDVHAQDKSSQAPGYTSLKEFNWVPWNAAPKTLKDYINSRDKNIYQNILMNSKATKVAVQDLDFDEKNDVIISISSPMFCGAAGCRFYMIPGEIKKKTLAFNAHQVKPMRRGILADETPNRF